MLLLLIFLFLLLLLLLLLRVYVCVPSGVFICRIQSKENIVTNLNETWMEVTREFCAVSFFMRVCVLVDALDYSNV